LRKELGREKNGNPVFARAWKGFEGQKAITTIKNISYQVSKHGLLKPVAHLEPVELDGVTVSNVTLINAKFIKNNHIGIGSEVVIIRSGQVIPKVIEVIKAKDALIPDKCPSCNQNVIWNENEVELVCRNHNKCPEQRIQKIVAFFSIMEVENLREGIIRQLFQSGYNSIEKILKMSRDDFAALENFKEKRATVIFNSIHSKMKDVALEKIMHASSLFEGLGSKKLVFLNIYDNKTKKPNIEEIVAIDGFSDRSAEVFINNFDAFWEFVKDLPIKIADRKKRKASGRKLKSVNVCFSGFRNKDLESLLENNGGTVSSSVTKNTSHLVIKKRGSGSSKEKKAKHLGIKIFELDEFEKYLDELLK
jgi:DNA ligase (NAD+)